MGLISRVSSRTYRNTFKMPENVEDDVKRFEKELNFIRSTVNSGKVVMFSATYCRWCKVAAGYFKQFDQNVRTVQIDKPIVHDGHTLDETQRNMFGILAQATDQKATV